MTGVLLRRGDSPIEKETDTHREGGHVMMEAERRVMGHKPRSAGTPRNFRVREEPSWRAPGRSLALQTP
jgi:hypothetical protein